MPWPPRAGRSNVNLHRQPHHSHQSSLNHYHLYRQRGAETTSIDNKDEANSSVERIEYIWSLERNFAIKIFLFYFILSPLVLVTFFFSLVSSRFFVDGFKNILGRQQLSNAPFVFLSRHTNLSFDLEKSVAWQ